MRHLVVDALPGEAGSRVALPEATEHRLRRVLRLAEGARVTLVDGHGLRATARVALEVLAGRRSEPRLTLVLEGPPVAVPRPRGLTLVLAQGLLKAQRMDWLVEKATELGVDTLAPVLCARSVARAQGGKRDRWLALAIEASEQCGRVWLPDVREPRSLDAILNDAPGVGCAAIVRLDEVGGAPPLSDVLRELPRSIVTCIFCVGPEGAFAPGELALLDQAGALPASLGPTVLRGETAALATLAVASMWRVSDIY